MRGVATDRAEAAGARVVGVAGGDSVLGTLADRSVRVTWDDVLAVDANASFARPGPRLVHGVEALAGILHRGAAQPPVASIAQRLR